MTSDVPMLMSGICEADETYVGGSWKNKAIHIRRQGSKRGRGTSKQAIFAVLQRYPQQVRAWLVPNSKGRTTRPLIISVVELGSSVYTDGHRGYRSLPHYGYIHEWVDHDAGEYVRGDVHTQTLDGYWGLLKVHLSGIGGVRKDKLPLFIGG
jgi:transposase-like protein